MLINQQTMLHKVSLSRNTHKTRYILIGWCKCRGQRPTGTCFPEGQWFGVHSFSVHRKLLEQNSLQTDLIYSLKFVSTKYKFEEVWENTCHAFKGLPVNYLKPYTCKRLFFYREGIYRIDNNVLGWVEIKKIFLYFSNVGHVYSWCKLNFRWKVTATINTCEKNT